MNTDDTAQTQQLFPFPEPSTLERSDADAAIPGPADAATPARPRVRWAGIVWGLVLAALAASGVWLTAAPSGFDDLVAAAPHLTPTALIAVVPLTLGALVLVTGLVGLLRRAQRRTGPRMQTPD